MNDMDKLRDQLEVETALIEKLCAPAISEPEAPVSPDHRKTQN